MILIYRPLLRPPGFVPQGHAKIAQRFIAGLSCAKLRQAPQGRKIVHDHPICDSLPSLAGPGCRTTPKPTDESVGYFLSPYRAGAQTCQNGDKTKLSST